MAFENEENYHYSLFACGGCEKHKQPMGCREISPSTIIDINAGGKNY